MKKLTSLIFILFLLAPACISQDQGLKSIIAKGENIEKLADGFSFTEGPTPDKEGNVFFTDQPNDRILKWDNKTGLSIFMEPCGRSNGMAFDSKGNLWSCADEKNELWKISPDKKVEKVTGTYEGHPFDGPNDLWISPSGAVYFTDPFYKRTWWDHSDMPQDKQCVYLLEPSDKSVKRVADDLLQPNGIVGTPDGKTLYVADIKANKTWAYTINADGTLSGKRLFCELGSDGMTIDSKGNIYLTGKGVTIFDRSGKKLGNIPVPESWTANVCFGGKDLKYLFITASKSLYRIRLSVKGTTF